MQPDSYEGLHRIVTAIVRDKPIAPLIRDANPQTFAGRAARCRSAALISNALSSESIDGIEPLRRALRVHEISNALKAENLRAQLGDAIKLLNDCGIVPVLLKGAARIWERTSGYQLHDSVDLDMLLPREQVRAAAQTFEKVGYKSRASRAELRHYERRHHHAAPLFPPAAGVSIELHRELFPRDRLGLRTDYDELKPYFREAHASEGRALVLNDVGTALHLTVHAFGRPPLRDLCLLATLLRAMSAQERMELTELLSRETKEPVRLSSTAYEAACMAALPWHTSQEVRSFANWCALRERLPKRLYSRTDCVDAALAHPNHPVRAFVSAAISSRPIAEPLLRSFVHHPVRVALRVAAGLRILSIRGKAVSKRGGVRATFRKLVAAHRFVYRIARVARSAVRRCVLPRLSPEALALTNRYPQLADFVAGARRGRKREAAFRRLVASTFLTDYLNGELARIAGGEASLGRETGYRRRLTILRTPEFDLRIYFLHRTDRMREITSVQRHTMISPIAHAFEVRRFTVPQAAQQGMFDRGASLSEGRAVQIAPGETLSFRPGCDAYVVVSDAEVAAFLAVEDVRSESLSWRFDPASLQCVGAVTNDAAVSRLRETLELAAALKVGSVIPAARSLLDHPSHLVRWSTIAAVVQLSKPAAIPLVRRIARDTHPQLRRAAQRLLQRNGVSWQ